MALSGCVWRSDYDALQAENNQLKSQLAASQAQVARLQGALKYTVNSDLLFPSGGWQLSEQGKTIIARVASQLSSTHQDHLLVSGFTDNQPIGPALQRQGVTSNEELSQRRADNVKEFLISQGFRPELITTKGFGDANPVAPNDTAAGRAQNRRVEISLASGSM
jgi:chemotaxis protein MotB